MASEDRKPPPFIARPPKPGECLPPGVIPMPKRGTRYQARPTSRSRQKHSPSADSKFPWMVAAGVGAVVIVGVGVYFVWSSNKNKAAQKVKIQLLKEVMKSHSLTFALEDVQSIYSELQGQSSGKKNFHLKRGELRQTFRRLGFFHDDIKRLQIAWQTDGRVEFVELMHVLTLLSSGCTKRQKLEFTFEIYDIRRSGYIYISEFENILMRTARVGGKFLPSSEIENKVQNLVGEHVDPGRHLIDVGVFLGMAGLSEKEMAAVNSDNIKEFNLDQ